jgi:hypothetical protein
MRNRGLTTLAVASLALALLSGCSTSPGTGDEVAWDRANALAAQFGFDIDGLTEVRQAEYLAASAPTNDFQSVRGERVTIEPLSWTGVTNVEPGAEIEIRYGVDVDAKSPETLFGSQYAAGSATRCYRFIVFFNDMDMTEIDCPDGAAPTPPEPEPLPSLPANAEELLETALAAADPQTLGVEVRAAFPSSGIAIETDAADGRLIAAISVPGQSDCIVGVREADGIVTFPSFDPMWLKPGELGCSTRLVTNPPL